MNPELNEYLSEIEQKLHDLLLDIQNIRTIMGASVDSTPTSTSDNHSHNFFMALAGEDMAQSTTGRQNVQR